MTGYRPDPVAAAVATGALSRYVAPPGPRGRITEIGLIPALVALWPVALKIAGYLGLMFAPTAIEAMLADEDPDSATWLASGVIRGEKRFELGELDDEARATLTGDGLKAWTGLHERARQIIQDDKSSVLDMNLAIKQLAAALKTWQATPSGQALPGLRDDATGAPWAWIVGTLGLAGAAWLIWRGRA